LSSCREVGDRVSQNIICILVLAPVLVPTNVGDIPSHLPVIDDYVNTVPGNTNFPGLLDTSSSTTGLLLLHTVAVVCDVHDEQHSV